MGEGKQKKLEGSNLLAPSILFVSLIAKQALRHCLVTRGLDGLEGVERGLRGELVHFPLEFLISPSTPSNLINSLVTALKEVRNFSQRRWDGEGQFGNPNFFLRNFYFFKKNVYFLLRK